MKKKTYIAPEVVTVEMPKQPLMTTVSGFAETTDTENPVNPENSLGKGGWLWSDDEPDEYYDE